MEGKKMKTNTTLETLEKALVNVNKRYKGNVIFKRYPEKKGRQYHFTLKVKNSREPGARIGFEGHHIRSACWHVHGNFFEEVFKLDPGATIISGGSLIITKDAGNWQDRNIGSIMKPLYYSDACECEK
jgi:hypothetical protein